MPVLVARRKPWGMYPNRSYSEEDYQVYHNGHPVDELVWADKMGAENYIQVLAGMAHGAETLDDCFKDCSVGPRQMGSGLSAAGSGWDARPSASPYAEH